MKKKLLNWIKRYWMIVWLVTVAVLLAVGVSLAAYTSFNSVKRVVSTGKVSDTLFSSNYLSLVSDNEYPTRRISPSETNGNCTFTVQICNYIYGNTTSWNTKNITYTFTVKVLPRNGDSLPSGVENITVSMGNENATLDSQNYIFTFSSQTLQKDKANEHAYTITVPADLKDQIKFEIVAEPNDNSKSATNQQKLAANIILSILELTKNWTGKFLDDKSHAPYDYDAFNYEISGNGAGTVQLTWNPDVLQISKWFLDDVNAVVDGSSCTFTVGGEDENGNPRPTAYQLQFYKVSGATMPGEWGKPDGLEGYVDVIFPAS